MLIFLAAVLAPLTLRHRAARLAVIGGAIALLTLVLVTRWGSFVVQAPFVLPDEAQFLAAGQNALHGYWAPFANVDSGTVAFVVPYSTLLAQIAGSDMYFVARAQQSLMLVSWALAAYVAVRRSLPITQSYVASAPTVSLAIVPWYYDWYSYTAEVVSLTLLFWGVALLIRCRVGQEVASRQVFIGYALVGLAPFAKYQVGPLAVAVLASFVILRTVAQSGLRRKAGEALFSLAAAGSPILVIAVLAALNAGVRAGIKRSADFLAFYLFEWHGGRLSSMQMLQQLDVVQQVFVAAAVLLIVWCGFELLRVAVRCIRHHRAAGTARAQAGVIGLLLLPAALYSVLGAGRAFPHYYWYLDASVFFVLVLLSAAMAVNGSSRLSNAATFAPLLLGALVVASPIVALSAYGDRLPNTPVEAVFGQRVTFLTSEAREAVRVVERACPGPIFVWRTDPNFYLQSGRPYRAPTASVAEGDRYSEEAVRRDLLMNPVSCIVDATGSRESRRYFSSFPIDAAGNWADVMASYRLVFRNDEYVVWQHDSTGTTTKIER